MRYQIPISDVSSGILKFSFTNTKVCFYNNYNLILFFVNYLLICGLLFVIASIAAVSSLMKYIS